MEFLLSASCIIESFSLKQHTYRETDLLADVPPVKSRCWTYSNLQALICPLFRYVRNSTLSAPWWKGDSESTHAWNFIKPLCFHLLQTLLFLIEGLLMNGLFSASINPGSFHLCSEIEGPKIREWAWLCMQCNTLFSIQSTEKTPWPLNHSIVIGEFMGREDWGGKGDTLVRLRLGNFSEYYCRDLIDGSLRGTRWSNALLGQI